MSTSTPPPSQRRLSGEDLRIFSLETGEALVGRICDRLGVDPARHEEREFEDGEHKIRPLETVAGADVYLVASLRSDRSLSVDRKLVRTLFFAGALRDAGADRVTLVAPYLCYARKDRRTKPRDPVSMRYVALLVESVGVDRVVTLAVHNPAAFENAFRIPTAQPPVHERFAEGIAPAIRGRSVAVVSPDAGGVKRAERFRKALERRLERPVDLAYLEKFRSEGVVRGGAVVGTLKGRNAVIYDDLISSGTTMVRAFGACREEGAAAVYGVATHGLFSAGGRSRLAEAEFERLFVFDTVGPIRDVDGELGERLSVLDCAPLLASAIRELHFDGEVEEFPEL